MNALLFVLLVLAGWIAVSALVFLAVMPLLRMAHVPDERPALDKAPAAPVVPVARKQSLSVLRESGYLGIVLERLVLHASTIFAADQVCVFGRDARTRDDGLVLVQGAGVSPDLIGRPLDVDWDPLVAALACGRPLAVPGRLWPAWEAGDGAVRTAAIAPVWFGGRLQGAVAVTHHRGGRAFDMEALGRLGDFAELVGQALAHTVGRQLSVADPQPEIDGLLAAMERTAPGSGATGDEVARIARVLADDLGMSGPDLLELELGARLHAVGRMRMPTGVIRAQAAPGRANRELLRLEPLWGADMVASIPGLEAVALIVRHSRECWDGEGHPDGLPGEQVPLASRIVAVAEACCSAPHQLEELAGSSLDPQLVERLAGSALARRAA